MVTAFTAVLIGLLLLVWSATRFVEGASATAHYFGMPALLIGMVIVGFGTSAPELAVSTLAAIQKNPGIALGNAYGSNITNIALILGLTSILSPVTVHSQVLRKELPMLFLVTLLAAWQISDGDISRMDATLLLILFTLLMGWSIRNGYRSDTLGKEVEGELGNQRMPLRSALLWLVMGLILLIISSRLLVWGAVEIAQDLGVSDTIIGLTVVAVGTSLPELASSIIASRKGEHDLVLGNVLGSNLFNTLAVVGIAGIIHPIQSTPDIFHRDMTALIVVTIALFAMGYGFRGSQGKISRLEGSVLLTFYFVYVGYLISSVFSQ